MPLRLAIEAADGRALPSCPDHPGSLVRRYRSHGANGPGVYPQCVPAGPDQAHLLSWPPADPQAMLHDPGAGLSATELEVLRDAAAGLTTAETAIKHYKSRETVKSQRKAILIKLSARNMTHAVAIAVLGRELRPDPDTD
jgi:DNA-binding CsgD family transcriptional regulator